MTIRISQTILAGNMGEGWTDDAVFAYAEYLEAAYLAEAEKRFPGAEIDVDVNVECNASGYAGNAMVLGGFDALEMAELERDLAEGRYWDEWANSPAAAQFVE